MYEARNWSKLLYF